MAGQPRTTLIPRAVAIEIELAERERQKKINVILETRRRYEEAIGDLDNKLIQLGYQRPILTNAAGGDIEEAFFEAYRNLRSIARAAKAVGISAERARKFIKTYPEFKARFDMVRDEIVDDVDAGLINDLMNGKAMPIERIFFLKHNRSEIYGDQPKKLFVQGQIDHVHGWEETVSQHRQRLLDGNLTADDFILDAGEALNDTDDGSGDDF